MCGIVGFITTETKVGEPDRAKFLKQALIIDTLRGDDSTGMFLVGHEPKFKDGTPYWFKQLGTGGEFVECKEYWESAYDVSPYRAAVGHNRAATVGSVDADSAHPFQEGPITLVHNGTLTTTMGLPDPMAGLRGITVDSHAICHNLANHPVEDVIAALHGAFALVWHDARDDSMNIIRNDQRPLHFGMGQHGKSLFFMSEGGMLHLLDQRLKLGIKAIYYPDEGQYLKWLPDTPLERPITKSLELYKAWGTYRGTGGWDSYGAYDTSGMQRTYGGHYPYYDDDEDDYPFGGSTPGKPPAHLESADYIFLGGRKQAVPMLVQEAMLKHDIVTDDRLAFTPTSAGMNPHDSSRFYVTGMLEGTHKAILYNCEPGVGTRTDRDWCVRVVGVKLSPEGEPWFICRLVSTFINPAIMTSNMRSSSNDVAYDQVPGRDGFMIPAAEWYAEVAGGCVMCTAPIGLRDSYDIVWTADGPICPNCDDRLYEPNTALGYGGLH